MRCDAHTLTLAALTRLSPYTAQTPEPRATRVRIALAQCRTALDLHCPLPSQPQMDSMSDELGEVVSRDSVTHTTQKQSNYETSEHDDEDAPRSKKARTASAATSATAPASEPVKRKGRALSHQPPRQPSPLFRSSTALNILQAARAATAHHALQTLPRARSPASMAMHHPHHSAGHAHGSFMLPAAAAASSAASSSPSLLVPKASHHAHGHKPFRAPARTRMELDRQALPIYAMKDQLLHAIAEHDSIIVIGETGSGKSTQLPQYILNSGLLGRSGQIGCTQPRRVAAMSVAARVATEYGCTLGQQIGYTIRFDDMSSAATRLRYLTDGMLLREIIHDPALSRYNCIVLDEAHERTVATDILFALLKSIQKRRKRILAARHERNLAIATGTFVPPASSATAAAAATSTAAAAPTNGHAHAKSPKHKAVASPVRAHASASAASAPHKSPRRSPGKSPSAAALASAAAASAAFSEAVAAVESPAMHPLSLSTDTTHPEPRAQSKAAKKERKKRKREEAEAHAAALAAAQNAPPTPVPAAAAVPAPSVAAARFSLDDENAPIDLDSIPNLHELQDLKLVIMSATLAAEAFSAYFQRAPIMRVEGRTFPVELLHAEEPQVDYLDAAIVAVLQIHLDEANRDGGDILVFLTGSEEIENARKTLEEKARGLEPDALGLHVVPLYANLPPELQLRVFDAAPARTRKVILSTNIAETSLTIPGIRFVVDTGVTKLRMYNASNGNEVLRVVEVSQAEAKQRSGRAGRDAPGVAFRLYTEEAFARMKPNLIPEILRSNLASVVLQLKSLRVAHILSFDFMTPPSRGALTKALEELYVLRALNYNGELSALGAQMVSFPLPPHYAKILIESCRPPFSCSVETTKIIAMMSVESIFFMPGKNAEAAAASAANASSATAAASDGQGGSTSSGKSALSAFALSKRHFAHSAGDPFTFLDIFNAFLLIQQSSGDSHRKALEWCKSHYLNYRNLLKVTKIYDQLRGILSEKLGLPFVSSNASATGSEFDPVQHTEPIKKALLLGLFNKVARKQANDASYLTLLDSQIVYIHPSSVLISRPAALRPALIVYSELVQTSRAYMRDCMELDEMKWLVELVPEAYGSAGGDSSSGHGNGNGSELRATAIKGGKQQAELHKRLESNNSNQSKLSGGGGLGANGKAGAGAAAKSNGTAAAAGSSSALVKTKKQLKKERHAAAAAAAAASGGHAAHARPSLAAFSSSLKHQKPASSSAAASSDEPRPPKQKKPKKSDGSKSSALLDFVNSAL